MVNKTYLQCGYEDDCKNKDCLKCTRRKRHDISLTLAEEGVIEDFAVCDLKEMVETKPKELELMQKVCFNIMKKVFKIKDSRKETSQ